MLLYTNNGLSEREIKKIMPFIIASKRIKYLGINLTKELKDLDTENYKTLMKQKKTQMNGKIVHAHGLEKLISLKCLYYSKQYTDSTQFPTAFFAEIENHLKIHMEPYKRILISILRKKNKLEASHLLIPKYITKIK